MSKLMTSFQKAILASGLQDGMTISFHHHLRNGDRVLNTVLDVLEEMGYHDLTINASSLHRVHAPIIEHIKSGLITKIYTDYIDGAIGKYLTENPMAKPVTFLTHGGRAGDIANGVYKIDVAFIAASISDNMGNCSGKYGKSAFGSLGYGLIDARYAEKVIVITDELVEYPFPKFSIPETQVDYVVEMDNIGNPVEIATGIMQLTRNPVYLKIAPSANRPARRSTSRPAWPRDAPCSSSTRSSARWRTTSAASTRWRASARTSTRTTTRRYSSPSSPNTKTAPYR